MPYMDGRPITKVPGTIPDGGHDLGLKALALFVVDGGNRRVPFA